MFEKVVYECLTSLHTGEEFESAGLSNQSAKF